MNHVAFSDGTAWFMDVPLLVCCAVCACAIVVRVDCGVLYSLYFLGASEMYRSTGLYCKYGELFANMN